MRGNARGDDRKLLMGPRLKSKSKMHHVDIVNIPLFPGFHNVPGGVGFLPSTVFVGFIMFAFVKIDHVPMNEWIYAVYSIVKKCTVLGVAADHVIAQIHRCAGLWTKFVEFTPQQDMKHSHATHINGQPPFLLRCLAWRCSCSPDMELFWFVTDNFLWKQLHLPTVFRGFCCWFWGSVKSQ